MFATSVDVRITGKSYPVPERFGFFLNELCVGYNFSFKKSQARHGSDLARKWSQADF